MLAFAQFLQKIIEINTAALVASPYLPDIMSLVCRTLVEVTVKGLQEACVSVVLGLLSSVKSKLTCEDQKLRVISFYD